jgi:transcription-repair coupling factor (superfamily II helicase)
MNYSELLATLHRNGYERTESLHNFGEYVVLGDVVLYKPVNDIYAYRLHYLGEELEKIERLDGESWRSTQTIPQWAENKIRTKHGYITAQDYVVHPHHGIGRFERIVSRLSDGAVKTFVSLEYANNDRLLFPLDRQEELMPYMGSKHPRLTRLYSKAWQNTKERIQRDLIAIARGLLTLYANRQLASRPTYTYQADWIQTLEEGVDFALTEDQSKAWKEITADLTQRESPMDRLVCGDVGFGKTELAIRAAGLVLAAGKQVAVLAPTTVLAEQHYSVFKERFAQLPINIAHVSRLTQGQDKEILKGLNEGTIDLVIGTHRLLGKDVEFARLGLLIVDEEQKFGVTHKERMKKLRPRIDVLSLSATPIPRTLYMALSGLRGLSVLSRAPQGRLPIKTVVEPYNSDHLRQILLFELHRGGQVYLVHNRVRSIHLIVKALREILKNTDYPVDTIRLAVAHGQMEETKLAETMSAFLEGHLDILIASSIIENGLDSPRANTLVVLHSERFGLSDLYQLRGRVGRRKEQAYAYFFIGGLLEGESIDQEAGLTGKARERLAVLAETEELGSGWSVAVRDLEIRGGGNLLGHEQHGNLEAIGLLLYAQLLQEEIGRQALTLKVPIFQNTPE